MAPFSESALRRQVEQFYEKVRAGEALGPIFADHVTDWPDHLDRLTDFWSAVMLSSGRYKGNPYAAHLPFSSRIDVALFEQWLALWSETARELFTDDIAIQLEMKASRIANSLASGLLFQPGMVSPNRPIADEVA